MAGALGGLSALVVDDDRDIREELREYLQKHGMHVEIAADSVSAAAPYGPAQIRHPAAGPVAGMR